MRHQQVLRATIQGQEVAVLIAHALEQLQHAQRVQLICNLCDKPLLPLLPYASACMQLCHDLLLASLQGDPGRTADKMTCQLCL